MSTEQELNVERLLAGLNWRMRFIRSRKRNWRTLFLPEVRTVHMIKVAWDFRADYFLNMNAAFGEIECDHCRQKLNKRRDTLWKKMIGKG